MPSTTSSLRPYRAVIPFVLLLVVSPCQAFFSYHQYQYLPFASVSRRSNTIDNKYIVPLPNNNKKKSLVSSKKISATASSTMSNDKTPTSINKNKNDGNWRIIPGKDYLPHISAPHGKWAHEQYEESYKLYETFMACTDSYVAPGIQNALNCLDHAYRLYGPESVVCSFNGGKDAVVILHLVRAAHAKYYHDIFTAQSNDNDKIDESNDIIATKMIRPRVIYFEHEHEFPEVLDLLRITVQDCDLEMLAFEKGVKFAQGLKMLVQNNKVDPTSSRNFPMAFVLGTRSSDPNAKGQEVFAPSSHYMPPFMRVNPILDWSYGHVWHFLRLFNLPYCSLYDQGYTSLGTTKDTLPCPALAVVGRSSSTSSANASSSSSNLPKYWPAYMLRDWDQERAGRIPKDASKKQSTTGAKNSSTSASASSSTSTLPQRPPAAVAASVSSMSNASDFRKSDPTIEVPELSQHGVGGDNDDDSETDSSLLERNNDDDIDFNNNDGTTNQSNEPIQKTVGLLIIGDEILKGMTADTNTQKAAQYLRQEQVLLSRVVVVSDDMNEIVNEIHVMSKQVDVIITSGGVGPTHDDVTIKSVAMALESDLILHPDMAKLLKAKMNQNNNKDGDKNNATTTTSQNLDDIPLTPAQVKMATLPSIAKLRYLSSHQDAWPVLQCKNIFVLPGVPEFFASKMKSVATYLSSQLERSTAYQVVLQVDEASIVSILNDAVEAHPNVSFGSYPFVNHPEYKTVVTLEGRMVAATPVVNATNVESLSKNYNYNNVMDTLPTLKSRNSTMIVQDKKDIVPKEQRDLHVRMALDDLITKLPNGSVLRVDNDDNSPF